MGEFCDRSIGPGTARVICGMANLILRRARSGLNVQVSLPDEVPADRADSHEAVACTRIHLVSKATGKVLSPTAHLAGRIYGRTRRFLKSWIARIDLRHFPGSCCG
jgi:hypothetical protein